MGEADCAWGRVWVGLRECIFTGSGTHGTQLWPVLCAQGVGLLRAHVFLYTHKEEQ